jgi:O-antigen ligase
MIYLIGLYTVLFAYLAHRRFDWSLYLLFALLPTYLIRFSIAGIPMTLLEVMILVIVGIAIIKKKVSWSSLKAQPLWWLAVAVLGAATISVFTSPNTVGALGIWKAYFLEPIALFSVLISVVRISHLKKIFYALGVSAVGVSLFGFWQYFSAVGVPLAFLHANGSVDRIVSVFGYPNAVGLFLAPIVILYSAWLLEKASTKEQLLKIIVILVSFAAILLAESEGAILSVLGLWFLGLLWHRRTRILALGAGIVGIAVIFANTTIQHYLATKLLLQDYSGFIRRLIWDETWQMLSDNPIFGAGLAGYQQMIAPYHRPTFEIFLYPHNIVLNFWSELGMVGLLVFVVLIGYYLWNTVRAVAIHTQPQWLYVAGVGMMLQLLIAGLVDAPYFKNDLSVLFWLVILIPIVASRVKQSKVKT